MGERFVTRGFTGRRQPPGPQKDRLPPGQHLVSDFPVLSAGPTPHVDLRTWEFTIEGEVRRPIRWSWDEFATLPAQEFVVDISCVTTWTKLDTRWRGVSLDVLLESADLAPDAQFVTALCYGGYTTNLPPPPALNSPALVASADDREPRPPGP